MILKYKNEYNDYYEFLTFQLRERLNVLEKRKYILVYLLVLFMIVFLYGWSKGYVSDIKDTVQTEDRIFILRKYDNFYVCTPIIPNNIFKDNRGKEKFVDLISKYILQQ